MNTSNESLDLDMTIDSLTPSGDGDSQSSVFVLEETQPVTPIETDQPVSVTIPGVTGVNKGRSKVWNEFVVAQNGRKVMCRRCGEYLAYSISHSTSSMLKHLKRKHGMNVYPAQQSPESASININISDLSPASSTISQEQDKPKRVGTKSRKLQVTPNPSSESSTPEFATVSGGSESTQRSPVVFTDPCIRMKWPDHSDSFLRTVYQDNAYTDVTIVAEKQFFKAHRLILSSASELFDETFKITPHGQHPIMFLKDVTALEIRILLEFIYKGEVSIPPSLVPDLARVGRDLKVKGLAEFIWEESMAASVIQLQHQQLLTQLSDSAKILPSTQLINSSKSSTSSTAHYFTSGATLNSNSSDSVTRLQFQSAIPNQFNQQYTTAPTPAPTAATTLLTTSFPQSGTPVRVKNIRTNRIISTALNPVQVRIGDIDCTDSGCNGTRAATNLTSPVPPIKRIRLMPNPRLFQGFSGTGQFNLNQTTGVTELGSLDASVGNGETIVMLTSGDGDTLFSTSRVRAGADLIPHRGVLSSSGSILKIEDNSGNGHYDDSNSSDLVNNASLDNSSSDVEIRDEEDSGSHRQELMSDYGGDT